MNCREALERLLDAEPEELTLAVDTPLVRHARECARCSAVAARLAEHSKAMQVVALAQGRAPIATQHRARGWFVPVSVALAAAVLLLVMSGRGDDGVPSRSAVASDSPIAQAVPPAPPTSDGGAPRPTVPPSATRQRLVRFAAHRFEAARIAPSRLEAAEVGQVARPAPMGPVNSERNVGATGGISVAPSDGVLATVIQTGSPGLTVVWLEPSDTTRHPR